MRAAFYRLPLRGSPRLRPLCDCGGGVTLNALFSFLVTAWAIFLMIKSIDELRREKAAG